jgi:hypothetical protein
MNFDLVGGRTFLLTMGCGVSTYVMRWFDKLDNGSVTAIILASVCAYIAKSGWDEHSKVRADVQKTIASKQVEAAPPTTVDQVTA